MRMCLSVLLYAVIFTHLVSCNGSSKNEELEVPVQRIKQADGSIDLLSLFTSIEIVELKNSPVLGKIQSVSFADGHFFLADSRTDDIKVFDTDLNYVRTIGHQGLGPGEYRGIDYCFVNESGVFVFSNLDKGIYRYEYDGTFVEKISIQDFPYVVVNVGNRLVAYANFNPASESKFNLELKTLEGKTLEETRPFEIELTELVGYSGGLSKSLNNDDLFYYNPPLNDSIFVYDDDLKLKQIYVIDDLVKKPFPGGIHSPSFNTGTRNSYGHLAGLSASFGPYAWLYHKDLPYLKTALVNFESGVYYDFEEIEPIGYLYLFSDVRTMDDKGYVYSSLSQFVSKDSEWLLEFAEKIGSTQANVATEDFEFLIRFKY